MSKMVDTNLICSLFSAIYGNTLSNELKATAFTELSSAVGTIQGNMYVYVQVYLGLPPCN